MQSSLTSRVRSGVTWNAASVILKMAVELGRSVALSRLLMPDDFGLFGMALTAVGVLNALTNVGLETAIIVGNFPKDEEFRVRLDTVWTAEIIRRFILTLLLLAAVYPTARFYGDSRLYAILPLVSLIPLIQGFQNIGLLIYRKTVSFRKIVWFEQITNITSAGAAVGVAFLTRNVWALILGQLLSAVLAFILSYRFHPYRPRFALNKTAFQETFGYGKYFLVLGLMSYIITTADNVLVGKLLGATVLGLYVVAYNLAGLPASIIGGVLSNVMLPAYAELRAHGFERLGQVFIWVFLGGSLLLILVTIPIILLGDEIVRFLFGTKWSGAGSLLRILGLIGFCRGLMQIIITFLYNLRSPRLEAKAKSIEAAIFLSLLYPLINYFGAKGAAWAGVIVYSIALVNRIWFVKAFSPQVCKKISWIVVSSLAAGALGIVSGLLVMMMANDSVIRLISGGFVSIAVTLLGMLWIQPKLRKESSKLWLAYTS